MAGPGTGSVAHIRRPADGGGVHGPTVTGLSPPPGATSKEPVRPAAEGTGPVAAVTFLFVYTKGTAIAASAGLWARRFEDRRIVGV